MCANEDAQADTAVAERVQAVQQMDGLTAPKMRSGLWLQVLLYCNSDHAVLLMPLYFLFLGSCSQQAAACPTKQWQRVL